jgi:nucleoside-diphosphate kinase
MSYPDVDWSRWTVILLKPDCLDRHLVEPVLEYVRRVVDIVDHRAVTATEAQVFAHYDDMLPLSAKIGRDVPAELRRIFVGRRVGIALGHGPRAAPRLREIIGVTDPAAAGEHTIRGRFAGDNLDLAQAQGRLVDNLIHSSDTVDVVERDFGIWYGPNAAYLLREPTTVRSVNP